MKYICTVLVLFICYGIGHAQHSVPRQLHFNFLGVKDGLPEGSANCLLQDKYGYIWIGTQNGLVRFDGYKAKIYPLQSGGGIITDIQNIYEDSKGRLWVGAYPAGFYCYDRTSDTFINYELTPYGEKAKSNENYVVLKTIEDNDGNLWMRIWNFRKGLQGLLFFDPNTKLSKRYSRADKGTHFVNAGNFYDVYKDVHGIVWIGTDNGLYEYDKKKDTFTGHFNTTDSSQQKGVWQFAQDSTNADVLWATGWNMKDSKNEGLWRYDTKQQTLQKFMHDSKDASSIANDEILAIENFKKGYLWIGTDTGISVFNTATSRFENYSPGDKRKKSYDNYIKAIKKDADGNLWCQSPYGLLFFNSAAKTFTRFTKDNKNAAGLQSNTIRSMLLAGDGMLWFGADQDGLQWVNTGRSKFTLYTNNPGNPHHFNGGPVNAFAEATDGSIWLTSANGLYHWAPASDSFTRILPDTRAGNEVYANSATIDKEGIVWCRMYGNAGNTEGIYSYDPITKKRINYRHHEKDSFSLPDDNVRALQFDQDDILWVGSFGKGISSFDKKTGKFTPYPYIPNTGYNDSSSRSGALDDDQVQTIYIDRQNNLWAGTNNGNLNKFNRSTKKFTANNTSIPGFSTIISVFRDSSQNLWVGSYMSGLFRFDAASDKYKRYTETDGLLYNGCWGINEDLRGNIWIGSPRGLSVLNPRTSQVRNISAANGLPEEPVSSGLFKTKNGLFLSGSKDGFLSWNPGDFLPENSPAPRMHIESVSFPATATRKEADSAIFTFSKNELHLKYDENRITFFYVGLQYQSPALIQYAYQLTGYDNDWRNGGTQRQVTYTNLSPGTYIFHVKAMNSDGIWSAKEDAITIIISPPWWKTWWAYCLYTLLAAGAIVYYIQYRSRALRRENILLEEKIAHRTNQLEQSLTDLKSAQAQLIQSEKMASLGELTAGIAHEIQNPLNFVNNFAEVSNELVDEMNEELDKGVISEAKAIAADIKQNLQKINQHGKRADAIVKGMLQHSRTSSGDKGPVNINALADEYLRLAYHGLRAKDKSFNATLRTDFDESAGNINIISQDIGRVLLNIITNAFYAVDEKKKSGLETYQPMVSVQTKKINHKVEIKVADNGNGIPEKIVDKIFQPFFTTKPTGQGTGLGLSLAYDIVKAHGGELSVESTEGQGAAFIILLPV